MRLSVVNAVKARFPSHARYGQFFRLHYKLKIGVVRIVGQTIIIKAGSDLHSAVISSVRHYLVKIIYGVIARQFYFFIPSDLKGDSLVVINVAHIVRV